MVTARKVNFFSADYLPVQGWEPGGIQAERKRNASGTEAERKWDESGMQVGRKRNASGTEAECKRDKPKNVRQIKPAALRLKQGGIFQAGNARIILRINRN
jgi:hypothetical protein